MSAILSQEENNTATTDLVENAGKQIVAVTGNVLGGAVYTHTENATAVSKKSLLYWCVNVLLLLPNWFRHRSFAYLIHQLGSAHEWSGVWSGPF